MTAWLRRSSAGRDLLLASLALLTVYLLTGSHAPLSSSSRYAEAARLMVESGDWVVPHLHYVPYLEKPILAYWLGAAAQLVAGESWLAVNLPAGLASLGSLCALVLLARRLRPGGFALGTGLLAVGSAFFLVFASTYTTDPILAACLAWCLLAWWRFREGAGRPWLLIFWLALALAVLTKGLVGIGLAGMAVAGFLLVEEGLPGLWRGFWRMRPVSGSLILLVVNLPWWLAVQARDPRFPEYFWWRFNLQAFAGGEVNHGGEPWLYPLMLVVALVPMALPGLVALGLQLRQTWPALRSRLGDPLGRRTPPAPADAAALRRYLLCWLVFPLLLLQASSSKLGTYFLPLVPPLILLVSDALAARLESPPRWLRWSLVLQAILLLLALPLLSFILGWLGEEAALERLTPAGRWLLGGAYGFLVLGQILATWRIQVGRPVQACALACAGLVLACAVALPRLDRAISGFDSLALARRLESRLRGDELLLVYQDMVQDYLIPWTLRRRLPILGCAREVGMGHFCEVTPFDIRIPPEPLPYRLSGDMLTSLSNATHPWLVSFPDLVRVWNSPRRVRVIGPDSLLRLFRADWPSQDSDSSLPLFLGLVGAPVQVLERDGDLVVIGNRP